MAGQYTVVRGDNLTAIAKRFGLPSWRELYYSPDNTAFRTKRPNPNLIYPGDVINVPGTGPAGGPPDAPPPPVTPVSFPPVSAEIEVVAADLTLRFPDLEYMARLYEDDRINDPGSGNDLTKRFLNILRASSDPAGTGVEHRFGIFAGCSDAGFRQEFRDGSNQVHHFTTAADMGFRPEKTYALILRHGAGTRYGDNIIKITPGGHAGLTIQAYFCVRIIIGHEQVGDNAPDAAKRQFLSPTREEVSKFATALPIVTDQKNQDLARSRAPLQGIRIGKELGNSFQDLHLSLFGFKFGLMIKQGTMADRYHAADWIRTNLGLGGAVPDLETPPDVRTA